MFLMKNKGFSGFQEHSQEEMDSRSLLDNMFHDFKIFRKSKTCRNTVFVKEWCNFCISMQMGLTWTMATTPSLSNQAADIWRTDDGDSMQPGEDWTNFVMRIHPSRCTTSAPLEMQHQEKPLWQDPLELTYFQRRHWKSRAGDIP